MAVDWEQRIDFDRLRRERLARVKELLAKSELGALLCFDMNNVRYITATHIGTWAQDKVEPLHAAAAERRADPVGLRLRRAAPPAELPVARRAVARGHLVDARRDDARNGARRRRGAEDPHRARDSAVFTRNRSASTSSNRPSCSRCRSEGHQRRRRPAVDVRSARDQDAGRDHAAHACRR